MSDEMNESDSFLPIHYGHQEVTLLMKNHEIIRAGGV